MIETPVKAIFHFSLFANRQHVPHHLRCVSDRVCAHKFHLCVSNVREYQNWYARVRNSAGKRKHTHKHSLHILYIPL